jgi:hypothetical protein
MALMLSITAKIINHRRDAAVTRALNTPPKPHKDQTVEWKKEIKTSKRAKTSQSGSVG